MLAPAWSGAVAVVEPTDPQATPSAQWHLADTAAGLRAPAGWAMLKNKTLAAVTVAVVDTDIAIHTPELADSIVAAGTCSGPRDFSASTDASCGAALGDPAPIAWGTDPIAALKMMGAQSHGTSVTAVMAAKANNGQLVSGVLGPYTNIKILPVKFMDAKTQMCGVLPKPGFETQLATNGANALRYAIRQPGVRVVNISAGMQRTAQEAQDLLPLIDEARQRGILIVSPTSNETINYDKLATDSVVRVAPVTAAGTDGCVRPAWEMEDYGSRFGAAIRQGLAASTAKPRTYTANGLVYTETHAQGSLPYPAAYSAAPYNYDNVIAVGGIDRTGASWIQPDQCPAPPAAVTAATFYGSDGATSYADRICVGSATGRLHDISAGAFDVGTIFYTATYGAKYVPAMVTVPGFGTQGVPAEGLSLASPMVAATAALLFSANPALTPAQVKAAIVGAASKANYAAGTITANEHLSLPRALANAGIAAEAAPPRRTGDVPNAAFSRSTRKNTFTDTVSVDDATVFGDGTGAIVSRQWTLTGPGYADPAAVKFAYPSTTKTGSSTTNTFAVDLPYNGYYSLTLTTTDAKGNTHTHKQNTLVGGGSAMDEVSISLTGSSTYTLAGKVVSGNIDADVLWSGYRWVRGTATVLNAAGKNVPVTFNLQTNAVGFVASGTVTINDPTLGSIVATVGSTQSGITADLDNDIHSATLPITSNVGGYTTMTFAVHDNDD